MLGRHTRPGGHLGSLMLHKMVCEMQVVPSATQPDPFDVNASRQQTPSVLTLAQSPFESQYAANPAHTESATGLHEAVEQQ